MTAGANRDPRPVSTTEFRTWMERLGPFERPPHVAVACSGGADSMALLLLAHDWATGSGGRVTALIVDHRLRNGSAAEARRAADWAAARGIDAHILTRDGGPIAGNLQAEARAVRYRLLEGWCRANGVLHLALAHHQGDQAETLLQRLARGSGVDGLAAMASIAETRVVRLLRPLLGAPPTRLTATLAARGQAHIEDPSNQDETYQRVRFRRALPFLAAEGMSAERLAATARRMGRARVALEEAATALLARSAAVYPEGYCRLDPTTLLAAPEEIGLRAFARALVAIGGRVYTPRLERLERLFAAVHEGTLGRGRTLGGCRILPRRDQLLVCREAATVEDVAAATGEVVWDGRFRVSFEPGSGFEETGELRRLGRLGWAEIVAVRPELRDSAIPPVVRPSLPALWTLDGVHSVPHLRYIRDDAEGGYPRVTNIVFSPPRALAAACFTSR